MYNIKELIFQVCQELQDEFRKNPGGVKPKNIGLISNFYYL